MRLLDRIKRFFFGQEHIQYTEASTDEVSPGRKEERGIFFGGQYLPEKAGNHHFMVIGTTGSGKSLTLRMMMHSVLPDLLERDDQRAIIFDVKQDMYNILRSIELPPEGIILLNPFDQRCWEWDMSKDVTGPDTAFQIASVIISEEASQNRYFTDAARDLLAGIMNVFIQTGGGKPDWGFSDVIFAARDPNRLEFVLSQTDEGRELCALHLQGRETTNSVISTLRTKLAPFEVIAALWSHARFDNGKRRRISLHDFLKTNAILMLGNNQKASAPIQAINRVIFRRLTELVLDQSEDDRRRTWFFLDEVRKLGELDGLCDLMTNGRSKGACVVLGFQDIDGLRAVYGKDVAGEITSMPASFGVLKVVGESTPMWASAIFGEQEVRETTRSYQETRGTDALTTTLSEGEQIRERKLYLPSEFRNIPMPSARTGLHGYFCSAFLDDDSYYMRLPPEEVAERANLFHSGNPSENFEPWLDESFKRLPKWTEIDIRRLKLRPAKQQCGSTSDKQRDGKTASTEGSEESTAHAESPLRTMTGM